MDWAVERVVVSANIVVGSRDYAYLASTCSWNTDPLVDVVGIYQWIQGCVSQERIAVVAFLADSTRGGRGTVTDQVALDFTEDKGSSEVAAIRVRTENTFLMGQTLRPTFFHTGRIHADFIVSAEDGQSLHITARGIFEITNSIDADFVILASAIGSDCLFRSSFAGKYSLRGFGTVFILSYACSTTSSYLI